MTCIVGYIESKCVRISRYLSEQFEIVRYLLHPLELGDDWKGHVTLYILRSIYEADMGHCDFITSITYHVLPQKNILAQIFHRKVIVPGIYIGAGERMDTASSGFWKWCMCDVVYLTFVLWPSAPWLQGEYMAEGIEDLCIRNRIAVGNIGLYSKHHRCHIRLLSLPRLGFPR